MSVEQKDILEATGDLVIVKQKKEEVTKSGIVLAKEATHGGSMEMFEGTILAYGPDVRLLKKGDNVVFGRTVFAIHKRKGEEYLFIYERYVSCKTDSVPKEKELTDAQFEI